MATFTDRDLFAPLADYTAIIDWGDGFYSCGKIQKDPDGGYVVLGTDTYKKAGTYRVMVTISRYGVDPLLKVVVPRERRRSPSIEAFSGPGGSIIVPQAAAFVPDTVRVSALDDRELNPPASATTRNESFMRGQALVVCVVLAA